MTSKRRKVVTYYKIQPIKSQCSFEHEALRSRDKLNTFYLHYHNTYSYQSWQGGCIHEGASSHKIMSLSSHGLVSNFDFSYTICRFKT